MASRSSFAAYAQGKQAIADALRAVRDYFEQPHRATGYMAAGTPLVTVQRV